MKNRIKEWLDKQKVRNIKEKQKEIESTFQVKESEETLCITHDGDVIQDFDPETPICIVLEEIRNKRKTALKYHNI